MKPETKKIVDALGAAIHYSVANNSVGLKQIDAMIAAKTRLEELADAERLYVESVSMDDHGVSGMSLYRDGGAEEGDRPVLVTLLPWDGE